MIKENYIIRAFWDNEAKVWVATSMNFTGLATEAETIDGLLKKIPPMLQDLLEAGETMSSDSIPMQLLVESNTAYHAH